MTISPTILLLASFFLPSAVLPMFVANAKWAVIAPANLDSRVTAYLNELAAQNRAQIVTAASEAEARRSGAGFVIVLRQENPSAFLQDLQKTARPPAPAPTPGLAREGYVLEWSVGGSQLTRPLQIKAAAPEGLRNALLRIPRLLAWASAAPGGGTAMWPAPKLVALSAAGRNRMIVAADFPSFAQRGVIEGFYGRPWTQQDRLEILRFEGQHAMNVYYYAPKDDPYHRKLWRAPYPPDQMQKLAELVNTARANFVDFTFAISPALSMVYSNDQDFAQLTAKLDSVARLGITHFALFLDDVPQDLQNPQDQARFKTPAAAHVYLINKLYQYLAAKSADYRLMVTPTTYTNAWGSRDYIRELGAGADPHVDLAWTGTEVVSPRITADEAVAWGKLLHRKPLVWDNFPVNDGIPWRLNLGPMRGRDPKLAEAVAGLFSNPMNQAHASMIPLQTVADYLWNPTAYDPERSYETALRDQYGAKARSLLGAFLQTYGDYWWQHNIFKPLYTEQRKPIEIPALEQRLTQLKSSLAALGKDARFQKLLPEIAPFPSATQERLSKLLADPAYRRLRGGRIQWRTDYDVLHARRLRSKPALDGDFTKWRARPVYTLAAAGQIIAGRALWKGQEKFSARVGLGWDQQFVYIGVDVTDPELYQPFTGRDIGEGDIFAIMLETAFRQNFFSNTVDGDEYHLLFSPGNFSGVQPSLWSDQDYLPPRPHPRDFEGEIKTAWKKTPTGFSGDIAIPAAYFTAGKFRRGYEVGLTFSAQKVFPPPPGQPADQDTASNRITFSSKSDQLFHANFGNPATYQRLVLK